MPNSDGTGNAWDGLKMIGFALVYILLIVGTGEYFGHWWAMMLVGAAGGAGLAKAVSFVFKQPVSNKLILGWAAIGAAAGFGFYLAL